MDLMSDGSPAFCAWVKPVHAASSTEATFAMEKIAIVGSAVDLASGSCAGCSEWKENDEPQLETKRKRRCRRNVVGECVFVFRSIGLSSGIPAGHSRPAAPQKCRVSSGSAAKKGSTVTSIFLHVKHTTTAFFPHIRSTFHQQNHVIMARRHRRIA